MTTFIGQESAEGDTLSSMPTHQAGDLLIAWIGRHTNGSAITDPGGWSILFNFSPFTTRGIVAFKIAASASETLGTWTSAEFISCLVYRPANNKIVVGPNVQGGNASTSTAVYNAYSVLFEPSFVVEFTLLSANGTNLATENTETLRVDRAGASAGHMLVHDTNSDEPAGSFASKSVAFTGGPCKVHTQRVQLFDLPGFATGGGGAAFQLVGGGGLVY